MVDTFESYSTGMSGPANDAAAVTPNDGADLAFTARALYVGGAGDISVITQGGQTVLFAGASAGSIIPIRAARVRATGTTATNIVALW